MITARQAIEILQKCNPDAFLRIYLTDGDYTDAVESVEEDLDQGEVYFYTFPLLSENREDVQNRFAETIEVFHHEGNFRQIKSCPKFNADTHKPNLTT